MFALRSLLVAPHIGRSSSCLVHMTVLVRTLSVYHLAHVDLKVLAPVVPGHWACMRHQFYAYITFTACVQRATRNDEQLTLFSSVCPATPTPKRKTNHSGEKMSICVSHDARKQTQATELQAAGLFLPWCRADESSKDSLPSSNWARHLPFKDTLFSTLIALASLYACNMLAFMSTCAESPPRRVCQARTLFFWKYVLFGTFLEKRVNGIQNRWQT